MRYRLLAEFQRIFEGKRYRHRASNLGDFVAMHLYEDLVAVNRSRKLIDRIKRQQRVINSQNKRRGIEARRGDGTFGELVPGETPILDPGYRVARGPVATVEIGVEVKILAKAMIKQIDRVISDLDHQVRHFKHGRDNPVSVAVIGVNAAPRYTSFEGERSFVTDGRHYLHPAQEAAAAEARLSSDARQAFDEFLIVRFEATNEPPYPFKWVDRRATELDYGAILARVSREYERRF
jgi:hypothetical protein